MFRLKAPKVSYHVTLERQANWRLREGAQQRMRFIKVHLAAVLWVSVGSVASPADLVATGHDKCIYLRWEPVGGGVRYVVERAENRESPSFQRLTSTPLHTNVYCDWLNENGKTHGYRVLAVREGAEDSVVAAASATSVAESDEALLTFVQLATFRYFWDGAHPVSGLAYERYRKERPYVTVTTGGSGVGLMALIVGVERGFVSRADCAQRVLKILTFLEPRAHRYHGVFIH